MSQPDRVIVEFLVAAPIDDVWRALRDPAEIARWFGWEYPSLAEEIGVIFGDERQASEADHTLQLLQDRLTLEASGTQTIVRLIRSAPVTDASWTGIYDDVVEGWITFLQQLRFMLERHRGQDRRTLYLNGRATAARAALPEEALGLVGLAAVPTGQRYAATTTMGDALEGSVWFRTAHQIGLTVDGYGDGLLIVGTRTSTTKSPHGGGSVVLTTYGRDDHDFAALCQRWGTWWRDRYEVIDIHPHVHGQPA